jgi:hypothetical protein
MHGLVCDACGATLLLDSDVRYVLKAEGFAAYDPMELTAKDLERDFSSELAALLKQLEGMDPEKAQSQVHRSFCFDLCPACWQRYLSDPLRGVRPDDAPPRATSSPDAP